MILSDALNHASIIDGCRLSRAKIAVYGHCDMNQLERRLQEASHSRKLIVTESLFSMDGDEAPLMDIVSLAEKYGAMVMVDEAHATGVYEPNGAGLGGQIRIGRSCADPDGNIGKGARRLRRLCCRQRSVARAADQPLPEFYLYDVVAPSGDGNGYCRYRSRKARTGTTASFAEQLRAA